MWAGAAAGLALSLLAECRDAQRAALWIVAVTPVIDEPQRVGTTGRTERILAPVLGPERAMERHRTARGLSGRRA